MIRNTKVAALYRLLEQECMKVDCYDPLVNASDDIVSMELPCLKILHVFITQIMISLSTLFLTSVCQKAFHRT